MVEPARSSEMVSFARPDARHFETETASGLFRLWNWFCAGGVGFLFCSARLLFLRRLFVRGFRRFVTHGPQSKILDKRSQYGPASFRRISQFGNYPPRRHVKSSLRPDVMPLVVSSYPFLLMSRNGDTNVDVVSNGIGIGADFVCRLHQLFGLLLVDSFDGHGERGG
jgi:hypothetical protein